MSVPDRLVRFALLLPWLVSQAVLLGYAARRWRFVGVPPAAPPPPDPWWRSGEEPCVLVQLPVRDEPAVVVERLLDAVAALDWPADRLTVQLLDDSSEEAAATGAAAVERARRRGLAVAHVRRGTRAGYKAGALAHGLKLDDAPFVAVFDADFVPAPDFLRRLLPRFEEPRVGLVQARWEHLDRERDALARAQAVLLDAHQRVEHAWRQARGRFLNFNGTAGLWRRSCIESAGGWSHLTLTEDLDLSLRAQLAGWRFVYDDAVAVPSELPATLAAFRAQQHRWTKGGVQTARHLLPSLWRSPQPLAVKLEATAQLTAVACYPALLSLLLALPAAWTVPSHAPLGAALALHGLVLALGTLPVAWFLARGQWAGGRRGPRVAVDVALAMLLSAGLAWHLTGAVLEGLRGPSGEFVRTPKTGGRVWRAPARVRRLQPAEALLATACTVLAATQAVSGQALAAPFLLALAVGFAWVAVLRG